MLERELSEFPDKFLYLFYRDEETRLDENPNIFCIKIRIFLIIPR